MNPEKRECKSKENPKVVKYPTPIAARTRQYVNQISK